MFEQEKNSGRRSPVSLSNLSLIARIYGSWLSTREGKYISTDLIPADGEDEEDEEDVEDEEDEEEEEDEGDEGDGDVEEAAEAGLIVQNGAIMEN